MLTALPLTSRQLHRAPHNDGIISPFLLDPSTITSQTRHSTHLHKAIWLHMPVIIRHLQTRQQTIDQVNYLSNLRHPNLEQFLGAFIDTSQNALVTEYIHGSVLNNLLTDPLDPRAALDIAIDISRALVYLHVTTGRPHGALSETSVIYDHVRTRAVVLLPTGVATALPCAAPECGEPPRVDTSADVYSLAVLVLLLFRNRVGQLGMHDVYNLPKRLQHVVVKALCRDVLARPRVEELCQALMHVRRELYI